MQYYIKIFNQNTDNFVGYYKETGRNCISKMMNGMKYFNSIEEALLISNELDDGFVRDKDGKYYTAFCSIYGDSTRMVPKEIRKSKQEKEEELKNELDTFIRQNSDKIKGQTRN